MKAILNQNIRRLTILKKITTPGGKMTALIDEAANTVVQIKEFYVYELFDKRDGTVFYVGEGVRERGLEHFREADKILAKLEHEVPDRVNLAKIDRIAQIRSAGEEHLGIRVVGRFDTKYEAQAVEAILINWIYGIDKLTNISRGRGNAHMRPCGRAFDDLPGIDIPKRVVVQGPRAVDSQDGYLATIIKNHDSHRHFSMAEDIARLLTETGIALETEEPCYWEGGRYIALFIPLVNGKARMIVQLTDSSRNRHVYNIIPMSNRKADKDIFVHYLQENFNDLKLKKGGMYCKLPGWDGLSVRNEDITEIVGHIRYAQQYFTSYNQIKAA